MEGSGAGFEGGGQRAKWGAPDGKSGGRDIKRGGAGFERGGQRAKWGVDDGKSGGRDFKRGGQHTQHEGPDAERGAVPHRDGPGAKRGAPPVRDFQGASRKPWEFREKGSVLRLERRRKIAAAKAKKHGKGKKP